MPDVWEDLSDGLQMTEDDAGKFVLNRRFFCADLVGASPLIKFSQPFVLYPTGSGGEAHTGADIPRRFESLTLRGLNFYVKNILVEPWPPSDAAVLVTYDTNSPPVAGFSPPIIEVGSTLEQAETNFDIDNQILPWGSRVVISVDPPSSYPGAAAQYPNVPILVPKPTIVITRQESTSPESTADTFVGKVNDGIWRGYSGGTVLCLSIIGRNTGDGIWTTTYSFARDPVGGFRSIVRWRDPRGLFPKLTVADVSGRTGIKDVEVQQVIDFSPMGF